MQKPVILALNEPFYTSQISRKAVYYHVTLQNLAGPPKIQLGTLEGAQSTAFDKANLIGYILKYSIEPFPPNTLLTVITCHPNADAYRKGLTGKAADWAVTRQKGHRAVSQSAYMSIEAVLNL